jgi:hypothetical protein
MGYNYDNCVENFLGPDVVNKPIVSGSKISEQESARLELPLTLEELDNSIKNPIKNPLPVWMDFLTN